MNKLYEKYIKTESLPTLFCPGCGNGIIQAATMNAMEELDIKDDIACVSGIVLINSTLIDAENPNYYRINATEIAEDMGKPYVVNMVILGALTKLMPKIHFDTVLKEIRNNFAADIAAANIAAFKKGYNSMVEGLKPKRKMA